MKGQAYEDGALYHNNPVFIADSERKLLWPELADSPPDILISLGTGHNPSIIFEDPDVPQAPANPPKRGFISHIKTFKRIAQDHVKASLNFERTCKSWLRTIQNQHDKEERYIRLNISCSKDVPELDDIQSMPKLREYVREQFALNRLIDDVAHRLVASSFCVVPASSTNGNHFFRLLPNAGTNM